MPTHARPHPTDTSPVYAPFFEGLRDGRILVRRCTKCGAVYWPSREMCGACHSEFLDWVEASPEGEVYTFSVFYRSFHPAFADEVPYATVSVSTDLGVIVFGEYGGADPEALRIGDRVRAEHFDGGSDNPLLKFVPVAPGADEGNRS